MDKYLAFAHSAQPALVAFLREMVECESPSADPEAISRFVELFSDRTRDIADFKLVRSKTYGPHLLVNFKLPGKKKSGRVIALGHSDTVYPRGILRTMPWREHEGRYWGPGVLDMKSGLAFFVFAMRALRELDIPVARQVTLQLNSEEEIGSPSSRELSEKNARTANAVLVLEPGTGLAGKLKTARKGVGVYHLNVHGVASHAGVDFTAGASAILELARQLERIAGFTDLKKALTVNPGVISGGTRSNVVAEHASAEIDIRIARLRDAATLDKKFRALKPVDKRCRLELSGGLNRPPMERTPAIAALFKQAQTLARDLGIDLQESSTGGGSDGNFTAPFAPTLDGLGGVGEGAHAPTESILIDRIADRTALLAKLTAAL
ncbi:MAG: M20 family metallopeptidase [Bryobacteraceae bacterium]|nr:M20 family metallopeptidase [Bryobacteraceae bacterium]